MSGAKISSDPELCKLAGRIVGMDPTNANNYPSINYNGQIHPLTAFSIKGFLFYQGESNTKRALEYRLMMKKLIEDWRNLWGMGNLPFYYVQLFNMGISGSQLYEEGNWQDIREQQEQLLTVEDIPNIGMAVSIDTNEDPNNADDMIRIHPKNKLPVGERLAKIALKNSYHMDIVGESPVLSHYRFSNDTAYLVFKSFGSGLKMKTGDSELKGFALAGTDKVFRSAVAEIINESTIILKSSLVDFPVSARYAWSKNPICNLYNSADLPAGPFRTDTWTSGFVYETFASTCAASDDKSLIAIKINGKPLTEFQPTVLSYQLQEMFQKIPDIKGFANNPFAKIVTTVSGTGSQQKIILTVTAENGTTQVYEINYNLKTSSPTTMFDDAIKVFNNGNSLILSNNLHKNVTYKVFTVSGLNISSGELANNSQQLLHLKNAGVYFVRFSLADITINIKVLI
jgi:hypothetical protein